jgi:hypothetical protein
MRALLKVGFSLLVLAFLLTGVSYSMLRAQVASGAATAVSRLVDTEQRPLARAVGMVELTGPFNLTLRQGPAPKIEVRGEQRVLANVDTSLDGDTLHIAPRGILLRHRQPIEVLVTLPALQSLHVNGSGDHTVSGFAGERLELAMDGSGDLELTGGNSESVVAEVLGSGSMTLVGATRALSAQVRGSGDLDARHLRADAASLVHEGSGSSSVYARQNVSAQLTGSGDVTVYGNPDHREVSRSGSGNISFRD